MPTMLTVYGIPNCDTVRSARAWLNERSAQHVFHDVKASALPLHTWTAWAQGLGWEVLVNRRGTTWRRLDVTAQQSVSDAGSAAALLLQHPSLMKRPLVAWPDGTWTVGFDAEAWQQKLDVRPATSGKPSKPV